jgi:hypothetical protein
VVEPNVLLDVLEDFLELAPADRRAVGQGIADVFLDTGGLRVRHGTPGPAAQSGAPDFGG